MAGFFNADEIGEAPVQPADPERVYFVVAGDYQGTMRCWAPESQAATPAKVAQALDVLVRRAGGSRPVVESQLLQNGGLELNLVELLGPDAAYDRD